MKKIIFIILLFTIPCLLYAQSIIDLVTPNVAFPGQDFEVNIIVPEDFIVYGQDIWCWIEASTMNWDCTSVFSPEQQVVVADFALPYFFPEEECEIIVYSDEKPDASIAFYIVPQYECPSIWSIEPDHAIQGETVDLTISTQNAQSADPNVKLIHGTDVIEATSVQQTGPDEFEATVDIPDDITPADWLVVLSNLSGPGGEEWIVNNEVSVYSSATGDLTGHVITAGIIEPIEGATVTCTYKSTQTDHLGSYVIEDIPIGEHIAYCSALGYDDYEVFVTIFLDEITSNDFIIQWASFEHDPLTIFKHVPPGDFVHSYVICGNPGTRDLEFLANCNYVFDIKRNFGDLLFSYDATAITGSTSLFGVNTDGTYFYITNYSNTDIYKLDLDGTYIETLIIPSVTDLRDLAYDGTYFYGGKKEMYFWEMDFDSQSLISTTNTLMQIRGMTYDPLNDGFWVNNVTTDLRFINRIGMQQDIIPSPGYMMGVAYDGFSDGGPYLWCFRGINGPVQDCWIEQIDIATGEPTGVEIQVNDDLGDGYAGGLFCSDQIIPGKVVLGGIISQDTKDVIFGYEIKSDGWATITENATGTIPAGGSVEMTVELNATGMEVGEEHHCDIVIEHDGSDSTDVIIPVTMIVSYDVDDPPIHTSFINHFPNPATGSVEIDYSVPQIHEGEEIPIYIYNIRGQLINSVQGRDGYAIWNTENISSGIYFYKIEREGIELVNKVLIIK
jgi:hypothetical protein